MQQYGLGVFPEPLSHAAMHAKKSYRGNELAHQRNMSVNSTASSHYSSPVFSSSNGMPGPPPPTPTLSLTYGLGPASICDDSSRSTSAYSNIPYASLPLPISQIGSFTAFQAPSGQVKAMLSNVNVSNANRSLFSNVHDSNIMPPPPLPQHALDAKVTGTPDRRAFTCPDIRTTPQQDQVMQPSLSERRMESQSNESDVSMHPGCTSYPNCTSEDVEGHIIHAPSAVVQGRKEGSDSKGEHFGMARSSQADEV